MGLNGGLWLIGMMGSGKTTIGAKLAAHLGVPFFDTDQMVVDMTGMTIDRIWSEHGEAGFRSLEKRAVAEVPEGTCVVAAGGGAILDRVNREVIGAAAKVVWLKCNVTELARRVDPENRPLLKEGADASLRAILADRTDLYEQVSTYVVNTDRHDLEKCVSRLVEVWND